jgi:hypothetical protein
MSYQLVVSAPKVLHKGVSGDHQLGTAVLLRPRIGRSRAFSLPWSHSTRLLAYWSVRCRDAGNRSSKPARPGGVGRQRREPLHPPVDGDVVDSTPRSMSNPLDVAAQQAEAQGPADRQHDHIRWEAEAGERRPAMGAGQGWRALMTSSLPAPARSRQTQQCRSLWQPTAAARAPNEPGNPGAIDGARTRPPAGGPIRDCDTPGRRSVPRAARWNTHATTSPRS